MKKQKKESQNLLFVDFIEQIDNEIENSKTKKQFDKIIEKLEQYKENIQADNEVFKQSVIQAIDDMIDDIKKIN